MSFPELEILAGEIGKCFRCSLCKMVPLPVFKKIEFSGACPINNHYKFHHFSCSGIEYMGLALSEGRIEPDRRLAEIVFSCRTCGYCDVACKFMMDVERDKINMVLRETLVEQGLAPETSRKAVKTLKETGTWRGTTGSELINWAAGLDLKKLPQEKAKVLLYTGCVSRRDQRAARTARQFARLLMHAGVDFGILGEDETCCGLPAHWSGFKADFQEQMQKNSSSLVHSGVQTVVTVCGACLGALRSKYSEYGGELEVEVMHATELLERLIRKNKLKLPRFLPYKVTYPDPCYLGRKAERFAAWKGIEKKVFGQMTIHIPPKKIRYGTEGVFDPPRMILKKLDGIVFNEMYRTREYSLCCGGGGGSSDEYEEMSMQAAAERIHEARSLGAEYLITSCSHCIRQFEKANRKSGSRKKVHVINIIDLVYEAADID